VVVCNNGTLVLSNSSVIGNRCSGPGGGVYVNNSDGLIVNSTISGNSAPDASGLLAALNGAFTNGRLLMVNSTVGPNAGGSNASIYAYRPSVILVGNIIAANPGGSACTISAPSVTSHSNVFGAGCLAAGPGDVVADPQLGALQFYPTGAIHDIAATSPAVDRVPLDKCWVSRDQRGAPRPAGAACDSGAYESR
jgi:hypothetical protein